LAQNPDGYALLNYSSPTTEWIIAFTTLPGVTGVLIMVSMILLYTAAAHESRRKSFEVFWYHSSILCICIVPFD
jgi:hypothetical protein